MDILIFSLRLRQILLRPATLLIFTIFFQCICTSTGRSNQYGGPNAYHTLGLSSDCKQEDIRGSYRKLCLEYHPDKNVHKSEKDQKICENRFKEIQQSYSQIGTPSARKEYDASLLMSSRFGPAGTHHHGTFSSQSNMYNNNYDLDSIFRSMMAGSSNNSFGMRYPRHQKQFSFYVNGVDLSQLFNSNPVPSPFQNSNVPSSNMQQDLRPIFVQHTSVSLEDLYAGANNVQFIYKQKRSIFQQCKAVVRGGLIRSMILQSCVVVFPMLVRLRSWTFSLLFFIVTLFLQLPQKQPEYNTTYISSIESGWKAGTKLTFRERDYNVVFILDEKPHSSYRREGNNLHTKVKITPRQAQRGCTITLPALSSTEEPIKLTVPPNTKNRQVFTIRKRGWPTRKSDQPKGDMMVLVNIVKQKKKRKRKKR